MKTVRIWNPIGFSLVLSVSLWDPTPAGAAGGLDFEARASALGEQTARLIASAQVGALSVRAGGESAASAQAPLRHAAIGGAGISFDSWEVEVDGRVAPPQAGAAGASAEAAVRRESELGTAEVSISAHGSSLGAQSLRACGAGVEMEAPLPFSIRAGARAAAWLVELRGVASPSVVATARSWQPGPWDRFGISTLDWPERWSVSVHAARPLGPIAAQVSAALGAPAAEGALATRLGARIEGAFGPGLASIGGAVARLSPTGQVLAELSLSLGVRLGGVP